MTRIADRAHRPVIRRPSQPALEDGPPAKGAQRKKHLQNGGVQASRRLLLRKRSEHDEGQSGVDLNFKVPGPKN